MNPDSSDYSLDDENALAVLPFELERYVSVERLVENAQNYPEMQRELSEIQKERITRIKDVLNQIPLIHATSNQSVTAGTVNLLPTDDLPANHRGHSLESDRSIGLTQCVFFNWGLAQKGYGRTILEISSELLDSNRTFVTPTDFGHIEFADEFPFDDFEEDRKERIEKYYFSKMVTGKAWKEIIARRILFELESGGSLYSLLSSDSLGEVKHFGPVDARYIIGKFQIADPRAHYKYLYEHGFAFESMEQDRMLEARTGRKAGAIDPTHEQCGIDYEKACAFWRDKLNY